MCSICPFRCLPTRCPFPSYFPDLAPFSFWPDGWIRICPQKTCSSFTPPIFLVTFLKRQLMYTPKRKVTEKLCDTTYSVLISYLSLLLLSLHFAAANLSSSFMYVYAQKVYHFLFFFNVRQFLFLISFVYSPSHEKQQQQQPLKAP